ncbi:MAG: SAM-dependent methyltransferase [Halieaceae bacterium]|jgi:SAM-dependent methyltransferase
MQIRPYLKLLKLNEFSLRSQCCPLCGFQLLLRLSKTEHAVRCAGCRAGPAHMSLGAVLKQYCADLEGARVWEMSSRGPVHRFLSRSGAALTVSEYFDDVEPGAYRDEVQCQNVEKLSYATASFDLATSTEVFEHVSDDLAGFKEVLRVLKPGGLTVFTVPIVLSEATRERARIINGELIHLLPPEYHDDHLRGSGHVLCFRTYGYDIVERLRDAGFSDVAINTDWLDKYFSFGRAVIVAKKPMQV